MRLIHSTICIEFGTISCLSSIYIILHIHMQAHFLLEKYIRKWTIHNSGNIEQEVYWVLSRLWLVRTTPKLWLWSRLLQEDFRWIIGINITAKLTNTIRIPQNQLAYWGGRRIFNNFRCKKEKATLTYACLIISSTGVCAAWRGSARASAPDCCWARLTEAIKLKNNGTKVPQPPSLNKILNVCVEYKALFSLSGTTWT